MMKNIFNIVGNVRQWYLNHFVPYITIQQSNEHFFVSRQLWEVINNDLTKEEKAEIRIFFKYVSDEGYYLMIINPDMRAEYEEGVITEEAFARQEEIKKRKDKIKNKPRSYQIIEEVKRVNEAMKEGNLKKEPSFPMTFPLQLNPYGRIGFQGTQPTPAMIVYKYKLEQSVKKKYRRELQFTDRVSLRVVPVIYRPEVYGHRHAFILTPEIVQKPMPTFSESKQFEK